ncbi:hypothetical protein [Stenotrophomonas sp. SY1]|uniref:hypothetical protein n=1 Tax=Stenotrophomonas sp. SY1 TaxID=477235 RepID=UPI001E35D8C6|nr:hypothetical protein [Stenotrophomonas sp. SY1]MCD9085691.1 hypothetical protein [Stenotrophomonas sp. SY1]
MNPVATYSSAIALDAESLHAQARVLFDALDGTELKNRAAVPSAVNLVALGRFSEAKVAFSRIANSEDVRDSSYAQLWQLWLAARTHSGKSEELHKMLLEHAAMIGKQGTYHQALVELYGGQGTIDAVFAAIDRVAVQEPQRRDARAEAAFFAGGYLQYVRQDESAALSLYQRELPHASESIERPLLRSAITALAVSR